MSEADRLAAVEAELAATKERLAHLERVLAIVASQAAAAARRK